MNDFSIAPEAKADLNGVWDYLGVEKDTPAAARRQIEMLFDRFSLLATHPLLGEARDDLGVGLRAFVAGNYVIVYRISPSEIEIVRVVHFARDIRSLFE